jgi:hypothetical protein
MSGISPEETQQLNIYLTQRGQERKVTLKNNILFATLRLE